MKKNLLTKSFTESVIINKYLSKLNLNNSGTFNFNNDAAYVSLKKK